MISVRKLSKDEADKLLTIFLLAYNIDVQKTIIKWVEHAGKTYNIVYYNDEIEIEEVEDDI